MRAMRPSWTRRTRASGQAEGAESPAATASESANIQVVAHSLIADLYGTGLRVQNLVGRAPTEMQDGLNEIADQIDKVITEIRNLAFTQRAT